MRQLRARLRKSERPELRDIARSIDRVLHGEPVQAPMKPLEAPICWIARVEALDGAPLPEGPCTVHGSRGLCWLSIGDDVPDLGSPSAWLAWVLGVVFGTHESDVPIEHNLPHTASEDWFAEIARRGRRGDPPPAWTWYEPGSTAPRDAAADERELRAEERTPDIVHEIRGTAPRKVARATARKNLRSEITTSCLYH